MDSETRQLLLEAITLSRENNKMLKSMHSAQRRARLFAVIKVVIGLALTYAAYVYLEPYLKNLAAMFNTITSGVEGLKNFKPF